jgi:hypothetical protein
MVQPETDRICPMSTVLGIADNSDRIFHSLQFCPSTSPNMISSDSQTPIIPTVEFFDPLYKSQNENSTELTASFDQPPTVSHHWYALDRTFNSLSIIAGYSCRVGLFPWRRHSLLPRNKKFYLYIYILIIGHLFPRNIGITLRMAQRHPSS